MWFTSPPAIPSCLLAFLAIPIPHFKKFLITLVNLLIINPFIDKAIDCITTFTEPDCI